MARRDEDADIVLGKAKADFLPNIRFFGLGLVVVLVLGRWVRFVAWVGTAAFLLLLLWSVIRTVMAFGLGTLLLFSGTSATERGTEARFWAAKALVLGETIVYAIFVLLLYMAFFAAGRGNAVPAT